MGDELGAVPTMLPVSTLQQIEREIESGLPNEQVALREAMIAYDYYKMDGRKYIPAREVENDFDYRLRPKRHVPITRRIVEVLTEHLYSPGPTRHLDSQREATSWLAEVYADNLANSLWQRADRLSTLNGWCAFQVSSTGDEKRPIRLQLWGREQLTAFCHPDDCTRPVSVVTIDRYDEQTRYTWWTEEFYRVYLTSKLGPNELPIGRSAKFHKELSGDNPYGVIPFSFVFHELPTDTFDVLGVGKCVREANGEIDITISDLAEAIQKYHRPKGVAYDCDVDLHPIDQPGKFIRVMRKAADLEHEVNPRLEYLQAQLDISGAWEDVRQFVNAVLESLGVPITAVRMEQQTVASGIALVAEQAPLLLRAKERQEPFRRYELDLAKVVLRIGAEMGGRPELAAVAADPKLLLAWPEPTIPIPGPERDAADQAEIALGISSAIMVCMKRLGLTRDQAIEHCRRVAEDNRVLAEIFPQGTAAPGQGGAGDDDDPEADDDAEDEGGEPPSTNDDVEEEYSLGATDLDQGE